MKGAVINRPVVSKVNAQNMHMHFCKPPRRCYPAVPVAEFGYTDDEKESRVEGRVKKSEKKERRGVVWVCEESRVKERKKKIRKEKTVGTPYCAIPKLQTLDITRRLFVTGAPIFSAPRRYLQDCRNYPLLILESSCGCGHRQSAARMGARHPGEGCYHCRREQSCQCYWWATLRCRASEECGPCP